MAGREPTEQQVEAALQALSDPERFREAEQRVARFAPELQHILIQALHAGGWFDQAHDSLVRQAAAAEQLEDRVAGVQTLLAEETRMGMMVGVAVGWELARELDR